jgi:fibronectin-binding autotransporter adhesin
VAGGPLNDLTVVHGNLTLNGGVINVVDQGQALGPGVYRIINYDGTLTGNGLTPGSFATGDGSTPTRPLTGVFVQTSVPGQVNLVNASGLTLNYWDGDAGPKNNGVVNGGNGVWQSSAGNDNWTTATGTPNAPFADGSFAIFTGAPGTVTVDASHGAIVVSGMQFAVNGYRVQGDPINLIADPSGITIVRVGDGTTAGAGMTATIDAVLTGSATLTKTDLGTLVLNAVNTYTAGTAINGGVLQVASDANLGAASGGLSFDGGTLRTTADITSARATTLNAGGGTFETLSSTTLLLSNAITGVGTLTKAGGGVLILTAANAYTGGTTIREGTLQLGNGGTSGSILGDVTDNGTLAFNRSDIFTFPGVISGIGGVSQIGTGTTILTAISPYTGNTTVTAGTLAVGDSANPTAALSGGGNVSVAAGATLGGYGSVTGSVINSGTVAAANALAAFAGGPIGNFTINGSLLNAGVVNLAGSGVGNQLTVVGNYVGAGGLLNVRTVLAGDGSPSDKLVISTGTATGMTGIRVTNAGGGGALATADGILLVQAINGATTLPTAFSLARPVSAGAFDYFLLRGGVSPGSQDSWFLRNSVAAPPPAPPGPSPQPNPIPMPAPGTPPLPTPVPGEPPIPLFRPEVAVQSVVPSTARTLILLSLGTFNERQGDQLLLRDDMRVGAWGRVFGQQTREHFAQGVRPDFDGTYAGFQTGADLWRFESANGHSDHIGFYVAQARASGTVHGSVDGFEGALAGHVDVDASSYGGYWTHLGPSNWYIDALVQGSYLLASPGSIRGISNNVNGSGFAASIEGGYPIALAPWLMFEPQIQGIWQRVSFGNTADQFATITFNRADVFTGRAGALLRGSFGSAGAFWQPYLKGNVWWGSNGFDTVTFTADAIPTARNGGTTIEGGGGVAGKLTRNVSVYGDASYLSALSGEQRISLKGNVGLRVTW